jgi:hypothetical protein
MPTHSLCPAHLLRLCDVQLQQHDNLCACCWLLHSAGLAEQPAGMPCAIDMLLVPAQTNQGHTTVMDTSKAAHKHKLMLAVLLAILQEHLVLVLSVLLHSHRCCYTTACHNTCRPPGTSKPDRNSSSGQLSQLTVCRQCP